MQRSDLKDLVKGTPGQGHLPHLETERQVEWHIKDGGVFILHLDRMTGEWTGEQRLIDGIGSIHPLSPPEVMFMARARDLRFRDGTRAS